MYDNRTPTGPLIALLTIVVFPAQADAGEFGFSVGQDLGVINVAGAESLTNTGTRIGYRTGQAHLFGTVDFVRLAVSEEVDRGDSTETTRRRFSLATLGLGGRFFFDAPQGVEKRVIPYATATAYTVIPSYTIDETTFPQETWSIGGMLGFGADYYFTDAFSIGGEIGANGLFGGGKEQETSLDISMFQIYSGIQFSFYF